MRFLVVIVDGVDIMQSKPSSRKGHNIVMSAVSGGNVKGPDVVAMIATWRW